MPSISGGVRASATTQIAKKDSSQVDDKTEVGKAAGKKFDANVSKTKPGKQSWIGKKFSCGCQKLQAMASDNFTVANFTNSVNRSIDKMGIALNESPPNFQEVKEQYGKILDKMHEFAKDNINDIDIETKDGKQNMGNQVTTRLAVLKTKMLKADLNDPTVGTSYLQNARDQLAALKDISAGIVQNLDQQLAALN